MINKQLIKLLFVCTFLLGVFNTVTAQIYGDFPYIQAFTSGMQPSEITLMTPQNGANSTTFNSNGMQLTSAANQQFGAVYVNNKQFSSLNGIKVEFEYGMYGGTGADGISIFLFDAAVGTPVVGAKGAGLGYGYNRANNSFSANRESGLTGAYLGIGLDAYGNFKRQVYQGDQRSNGIVSSTFTQGSSHVTLRGKRGTLNLANGLGLGYTGYPVLTTQSTLTGVTAAATVNPTTGAYTTAGGLADNFNLRTATFTTDPNNADYRKAFIELIPNALGGFNVTVKIQHGTVISTVINNYWYRTSYTYTENANPVSTDFNTLDTQGANTTHTLDTSVPTNLRIGFGASTGGLNNIHLIRGLKVTLPYSAISANDSFTVCKNSSGNINPLTNDVAYSGPISGTPTASSTNIDGASFQFIDAAGVPQGTSYTQSGIGTWTYDSNTQLVTLTPVIGYTGTASVKYNIKGLTAPYNDEGYRSESSTITANIIPCIDSDGDGVPDNIDLDDDNDGILDAEESPDCFYTVYEANRVATVTSSLNGAGTDPVAGNDIPLLYNDNNNDGAVAAAYNFAGSQTITSGSPIFTIKYPTPIAIKSLTVIQAANGMASSGFAKLYGSNDGINYTLLTVGNGISIASTSVTLNNTATTEYLYYQIRYIGTVAAGNATSVTAGTTAIHEIFSLAASTPVYNPSAHPKPGICSVNTDGDSVPNHLDVDSDGDTCPDAYEGGATTTNTISVISGPYGANGLANSLETSAESGTVNYISTYRKYATNVSQNLCLDTDNDGVSNPIDLDDDNDGVLDTEEGDFCGRLDRNIRVGYLNTAVGSAGLATNLLYNLNNFGTNGVYNKVSGVTLIPFASTASVTEANLLAQNVDVFFVGSSGNDATTATDKIPTSVNTILTTWAKNNGKGIFALQNNAVDYGYSVVDNNVNPNTPVGVLGNDYYTNGYWPTAALNQIGTVQMTIKSLTRTFEFLMLDANLRPALVADREYNLVIFPDASMYNSEAAIATPTTDDQKAIADTWAYIFDKFLATQCTSLDTDIDGTPNHLDLDSDQDGCSDAIEAGSTNSATPNFAFITQAGTPTDSNSDGLADIVDANLNGNPDYLSTYNPQALDSAIKKCIDSDGDGYSDITDLDDDNDGILDTIEGLTCNSMDRNLRIGYLDTTVGTNGLMINMLSNTTNFSSTGTYNKFPGITFVPYATQAAITEAQLLTDNIDIFYVGSSAADAQTTADKLLTATNTRIMTWASNNDKGVVVLQNNAIDYGYTVSNVYPNSNPSTPYGPLGEAVFTNGYWPENTFNMSGVVQMSINSSTRRYETAMADVQGKATFIRDRDEKIVFIPDATIFISNQTASTIGTDVTLKIVADVWAFAFDTFLEGVSCTSTDFDNDGTPDYLDLDSDNDGCLDALEGGATITTSQLVNSGGTVTVGTGSSASNQNLCAGTTCVDTNGVPTIFGASGQTVGQSTDASKNDCIDSDGDLVPDWQDLDDDNDGILDTNECSASTNIAINNLTVITAGSYTPDANNLVVGDRLFKDNIVLNGTTYDAIVTIKSLYNPTPVGGPTPSRLVLNTGNLSLNGYAAQNPYVIYTVRIVQDNSISSATPDGTGINLNGITLTFSDIDGATPRDQTDVFGINNASTPEYMNIGSALSYNGFLSGGPGSSYGRFVRTSTTVASGVPAADINYWVDAYYGSYDSSTSTNNEFVFGMTGNENAAISSRLFFNNINIECDTDNDGTPNRIDLDSDNDGCLDAIEGGASITTSQLVNSGGTVTVGTGSTASNQNLCANNSCVSTSGLNIGLPQLSTPLDYNNASGQSVGSSIDALINGCVCYEVPTDLTTSVPVNHGVTVLGRAGTHTGITTTNDWPMVRNSAYTALEAKTKGFVITRIANPETSIAIPVVGMMVFDTDADSGKGCLKIYTGSGVGEGWKCFSTQGCP